MILSGLIVLTYLSGLVVSSPVPKPNGKQSGQSGITCAAVMKANWTFRVPSSHAPLRGRAATDLASTDGHPTNRIQTYVTAMMTSPTAHRTTPKIIAPTTTVLTMIKCRRATSSDAASLSEESIRARAVVGLYSAVY